MFESTIEYIASLPLDDVESLFLEDVALSAAWYESYADQKDVQGHWTDVRRVIDHWVGHARKREPATEGCRQQPILRYLVDELQAMRLPVMNRAQIDFLRAAINLIQQVEDKSMFSRVRELIEPHAKNLVLRQAALEPAAGLAALKENFRIVTRDEIQKAPSREVRVFAGIDLPIIGPVLAHKGDLKVLGDVPENGTVVVEEGSCWVTGYVLGRVAATAACEVHENVAGVIVTGDSGIRMRNALRNAFVVSKRTDLRARGASYPRHLYAGRRIAIAGSVQMGKYTAPEITIEGDVYGGEFHTSSRLAAARFRCDAEHPLAIMLRRYVSGADFGEVLSVDAGRALARATRLARRRQGIRQMTALAEQEVEHLANSALMYVVAGEKSRNHLEELETARRRMAFLDRIVASLESLSSTAEEGLDAESSADDAASAAAPPEEETGSGLEDFAQDLAQLAADGGIDVDLSQEQQEIATITAALQRQKPNPKRNSMLLMRLRGKLDNWLQERARLEQVVRGKERSLEPIKQQAEKLRRGKTDTSNIQLLKKVLAAVKTRPRDDEAAVRARSSFVSMLLRGVSGRLDRIDRYNRRLGEIDAEFTAAEVELGALKLSIPYVDANAGEYGARVTGRFEAGARLCTDAFLLEADDAPEHSVVETRDTGPQTETYARRRDRIVVLP